MNKDWSDQNKKMQSLLKKGTLDEGIAELMVLRNTLMDEVLSWKYLSKEDFCAIPFINVDGYHSKTIAYSLWHIFRIEDIVVNSLINRRDEVLFTNDFISRLHTPMLTTGNELKKMEIAEFSQKLDIEVLYEYIIQVKKTTDKWLSTLTADDLKITYTSEDEKYLESLNVVSKDDKAFWLIDFWCHKDIKGLIKMPLSRHWIMHIEAALRIKKKIGK